jgi:thiosulfate reductase/polysulfide reductase chain A
MEERTLTRRGLVIGSAATAALMAAGLTSMGDWLADQAHAAESGNLTPIISTCNACSSRCGFIAYVKEGKLWKLKGNPEHPHSRGTLCARGHGYAQIAYSKDRLTDPLKREADGSFAAISWEQAYQEIGDKVKKIIAEHGAESLALIEDPRPSGRYYSHRFINALGSDNYYHHSAACNLSLTSGYLATTGSSNFSADVGAAKMVLFVGRSYGDGIRPSSARTIATVKEAATKIVLLDPRLNNTGIFADQWLPVNPGTDLAVLLALANVLVTEELYDRDFVAQQTSGFEEWAAVLREYTPAWAEGISGIGADVITTLARELAAAAPQAVVEQGWRGGFGCQYRNSFNTARAVAALNALLGNWNRKGGALITSAPKPAPLDAMRFPEVPKPPRKAGLDEFPLMDAGPGSSLIVPWYASEGKMKVVFFYNSNAAKGYANPTYWAQALAKMELRVCVDVQMSETALLCDYVLPECSYLERDELPEFLGGTQPVACVRQKVIEPVLANTKPVDVIYRELAEACGVGRYFEFTVEELSRAQLESLGLSLDELKEKGVLKIGDPFTFDAPPAWKTPSGRFEFRSQKVAEAGERVEHDPLITWMEPKVMPREDSLRLIGGKQAVHSNTMTVANAALMAITREYGLERAWISASYAREHGIEDGDVIEISSDDHTGIVRAKVTERLNPTAVWIPTHYGGSSPQLREGYGVGISHMEFVPFDFEPGVGSAMTHEVLVNVKKVNG